MDTLGIEPRASRMLSGCDTTTPRALGDWQERNGIVAAIGAVAGFETRHDPPTASLCAHSSSFRPHAMPLNKCMCGVNQGAHGVVVSHPLRMRKALGSNPSVSTFNISSARLWCRPPPLRTSGINVCDVRGVSSACSVAVSYKPPMLVTRVRLSACACPRPPCHPTLLCAE